MYPIISFTVPSKIYNKVSMQHYYIVGTVAIKQLLTMDDCRIPSSVSKQTPACTNITELFQQVLYTMKKLHVHHIHHVLKCFSCHKTI